MGLFKKIFRPVRKIAKKIIPKEVKPFLPYIAAGFGPATAGLTGTAFAKAAAQKALIAAATSAATDEDGNPLRAGLLSITPDLIGAGTEKLAGGDGRIAEFLNKTKTLKDGKKTASLAETISSAANPETFMGQAKLLGSQTAVDQTAKLAEIQQDEIDAYNKKLREQGITGAADRRKAIRDIYLGVGYDESYIDGMLDRYGYKGGGISMTDEQFSDLLDSIKDDEDEDGMSISEYADLAGKGFQQAYGIDSLFDQAPKAMPIRPGFDEGGDVDIGKQFEEFLMNRQRGMKDFQRQRLMEEFEQYMKRQDPTVEAAEGGLMNLGGKEMDLRGGGFVPIGKKEKADDVPARLSKNEFVMTADAVRGAGNGDMNEGARRMYQTMDKLEAMA